MAGNGGEEPAPWRHLQDIAAAFHRPAAGRGRGPRPQRRRNGWPCWNAALDQAAWIDIEVASIGEMGGLLQELANAENPVDRLVP